MLKTVIEQEVNRLRSMGYDSIVTTDEIVMSGKKKTVSLGGDACIVTSIFFDEDMMTNNDVVSIVSANDCIFGPVDRIASMGNNLHKVMRQYIKIKKTTDDYRDVVVNVVKICPRIRL